MHKYHKNTKNNIKKRAPIIIMTSPTRNTKTNSASNFDFLLNTYKHTCHFAILVKNHIKKIKQHNIQQGRHTNTLLDTCPQCPKGD